MPATGAVGVKLRQRLLFWVFDYRCAYCGRHVTELGLDEGLTRDHVQPLSRGGEDTWDNVVAACSTCNARKANRTPEEAHLPLLRGPKSLSFVKDLVAQRLRTGDLLSLPGARVGD